MKRKYFYLMALAALTLGSCSNENDLFGDDPNGGPQGPKQQVTFLFPGTAQGVVPYADAPIASAAENEIKTLDVYVFGADRLSTAADPAYLLEDVIKLKGGAGGDLGTDADAMKATVSLVGTNKKELYFVANGEGHTSLNDYVLGKTTITEFTQKKTYLTGKALLQAPLLMTGRYAIQAQADGTFLPELGEGVTSRIVTLTRRVARFDIINTASESNFQIEKIRIKGARQGAFIFGDAVPAVDGDFPDLMELMEINFLSPSYPTANVGTTPSVFYVYPTITNGETSFELRGISLQGGGQMVQPVLMQLKQEDDPATTEVDETQLLPINPNTRYTINMLATGMANIDATITVEEWQVGKDVDVNAGFGLVKLTLPATAPADVTLNVTAEVGGNRLDVPEGILPAFDINVTADTEWEIEEKDADLPTWLKIGKRPTITSDNGTPGDATDDTPGVVGKQFSIEIAEVNPSSDARQKVLHIRNVKRPSIVQTLTVVQKGNAAGFKVTGERLVDGTLLLYGTAGTALLNLTLPNGVTDFECVATPEGDWITVNQAPIVRSFDGTKPLQVTVTASDKDVERTGTLTITVGEFTQTITVKQEPRNLGVIGVQAIALDPKTKVMTKGAEAHTDLKLLIEATTEWTLTKDAAATWLTGVTAFTDVNLNYNGTYTFALEENTSAEARSCKVTIVNNFNDKIKSVITVTQEGKKEVVVPTFTVSGIIGDKLDLPHAEFTETEYTVTPSNDAFGTLTIVKGGTDASWLSLGQASFITDGKFTLSADANTGTEARTATITITLQGAADPKTITVTQEGTPAAPVPTITGVTGTGLTGNALAMESTEIAAQTYTVAVKDAELAALSVAKTGTDTEWLTLDPASITTGTFTLAATANTGAERTATITVSLTDATPFEITVTQAAGNI